MDTATKTATKSPREIASASTSDALAQIQASLDDVMQADWGNHRKLEALRMLFHCEAQILGLNEEREELLARTQEWFRGNRPNGDRFDPIAIQEKESQTPAPCEEVVAVCK